MQGVETFEILNFQWSFQLFYLHLLFTIVFSSRQLVSFKTQACTWEKMVVIMWYNECEISLSQSRRLFYVLYLIAGWIWDENSSILRPFFKILSIFFKTSLPLQGLSGYYVLKVHYATFFYGPVKKQRDRALDAGNSSLNELTWLLDVLYSHMFTFVHVNRAKQAVFWCF